LLGSVVKWGGGGCWEEKNHPKGLPFLLWGVGWWGGGGGGGEGRDS